MTREWLLSVLAAAALLCAGSLERARGAPAGSAEGPARVEVVGQPTVPGSTERLAPGDTTARRSGLATPDSTSSALPGDRVAVYYFHRTARCENCLKFEAYADEALRGAFPEALDDGSLEWRVVNLDDTTNAHFVGDYDLFESSLVVSEVRGGREFHWRKLDAIWTLVEDKDAFLEYVAFEVGEELRRLDEAQPPAPGPVPVHGQLVPEPDGGRMGAPPQR